MRVNGLEVDAAFTPRAIDLMAGLLDRLAALPAGRRAAFLAGPPGSGKSTLAAKIALMAKERGIVLQAAGMDGFHLPKRLLTEEGLRRRGAPDTFDLAGLTEKLDAFLRGEETVFPVYDRTIHDPLPQGERIAADTLLLEGNWLLLDRPGWRELKEKACLTVCLWADKEILKENLIRRKAAGGASPKEAKRHYEVCDGPNIDLFLRETLIGDLNWRADGKGDLTVLQTDGERGIL